jgi:hypothetical protein
MKLDEYDYSLPFRHGAAFTDQWEDGTMSAGGTFEVAYLADLVMPTGELVACDAIVSHSRYPFLRRVPPGRYPVSVTLANITRGYFAGSTMVAFARVRFSDRPIVRWEDALRVGDDPGICTVEDDFVGGYPVDSGNGGFMDRSALLYQDSLPFEESQAITWQLVGEIQATDGPIAEGVSMVIDPSTGANVVAFMSGQGDGWYPSYWGLDEQDEPVCIVTCFGLVF